MKQATSAEILTVRYKQIKQLKAAYHRKWKQKQDAGTDTPVFLVIALHQKLLENLKLKHSSN